MKFKQMRMTNPHYRAMTAKSGINTDKSRKFGLAGALLQCDQVK